MIFYYGLGGGLGHVTRAQAVLYTLELTDPVTLLLSSSWPDESLPLSEQIHQLRVPPTHSGSASALRAWLSAHFDRYTYHLIIIDAFPGGLLGELCDLEFPHDVPILHFARSLRWKSYSERLSGRLPRFNQTFHLEELSAIHGEALDAISSQISNLWLCDPPVLDQELPREEWVTSSFWLIVHAGSSDEVTQLLHLAMESALMEEQNPHWVLVSPQAPQDLPVHVFHYNRLYPAYALFQLAERIYTGCGFNSVRQLKSYRDKHRFIPFPRRFDDQFNRASLLRAGSWDWFIDEKTYLIEI